MDYNNVYNYNKMSIIHVDMDINDTPQTIFDVSCPITKEIFLDPVIACDGFTYEKSALVKWFKKSDISPITGEKMDNTIFIENKIIKNIIKQIIEKNPNLKKLQYKKEKEIYSFNYVVEAITNDFLDLDEIDKIIDLKNINYSGLNLILKHKNADDLIKKIDINEFSVSMCPFGTNKIRLINDVIYHKCSTHIIKYVMDNTPDIDIVNNIGRTILDRIILNNNNIEIIEHLLRKSINFNIFSDIMIKCDVFTELCMMSKSNKYIHDSLLIMIRNNLECLKEKYETINKPYIHCVCQYGTKEIINLLYDNIPNILNSNTPTDVPYIFLACKYINLDIIEFMLNKNVDLLCEYNEKNIFHYIADISKNNFGICEKIFKQYSEQLKNKNEQIN